VHDLEPRFFESAAAFRAWLAANHDQANALVVGFHKLGSGLGGLKYKEAVDEALCFGWIDGHSKSLGATSHALRFTPRRRGSIWSAVNLAKMDVLIAAGRVEPAGMDAYTTRDPKKAQRYSFEQDGDAVLSGELAALWGVQADAKAWFDAQAPSYRKTATFLVMSAKQDKTRVKRMQALIAHSARGERIPQLTASKKKSGE